MKNKIIQVAKLGLIQYKQMIITILSYRKPQEKRMKTENCHNNPQEVYCLKKKRKSRVDTFLFENVFIIINLKVWA